MKKGLTVPIIEIIIVIGMLWAKTAYSSHIELFAPILALFNFIVFWLIIDIALKIFKFIYLKGQAIFSGQRDNIIFGITNISKLVIGLGFITSVFSAFGINIQTLLTSISIFAAAIAIITKDFIFDFLIGLYLSFSKDFEIGDYVKIGTIKGHIIEISMQKVRFQNDDEDVVIIPNSKIYMNEIINYTKRDIRLTSIDFQLDINVVANIQYLENELIKTLEEFQDSIESDSYNLKVIEMKKDYIDFKFQYTIKSLNNEMQRKIRKQTIRSIFNYISDKESLMK
jgi:small-conductance mechanosensitive channel